MVRVSASVSRRLWMVECKQDILECAQQPLELGQQDADPALELHQVVVRLDDRRLPVQFRHKVFPTEDGVSAVLAHPNVNADLVLFLF